MVDLYFAKMEKLESLACFLKQEIQTHSLILLLVRNKQT
jgi:hypothetical protein